MPLAWLLHGALLLVFPAAAGAITITNTATVTYGTVGGTGGRVSLHSNTVETAVLPRPTPAKLDFLRYDPESAGSWPVPIDGGQCRIEGGSFTPLPEVVDGDGKPLDHGGPDADVAPGYYTGEPVLVSVNDPNRNSDPASRDYADVDLSTTTGDAETLRLHETGVDTGIFAAAIQSVPMPPAAVHYDCRLSLAAFARITARYTDTDFPLDALSVAAASYAPLRRKTVLRLEQSASRPFVEIGDFLQYTLTVRNSHDAPAYNVHIRDLLPAGFRYRAGSLRVGTGSASGSRPIVAPAAAGAGAVATGLNRAPDPAVSADGRTLLFPVGGLAPGASVSATFVVEVGSGASGPILLNYAIAGASGGLVSNDSDSVVRMRESLATSRFTIVGRVLAGACGAGDGNAGGVANVRLLLDDGTYVSTDGNGAYHFEGVRPGTHVVQLDVASVPAGLEPAPCVRNTRFAGRAYSQFVEAQGGSLVRSDFYLRPRAAAAGPAGAPPPAQGPAASPFAAQEKNRKAILDDAAAAGGGTDWLAGQLPGHDWLFPAAGYNPRAPSIRVVVKHLPEQTVALRVNGAPVSPLYFDGRKTDAAKSVAASAWNGVALRDGSNTLQADILDRQGRVVAHLTREVAFSGPAYRAAPVPGESILVADGLRRPVIAVRFVDRDGHPVRNGTTGEYALSSPYLPAETVAEQQQRQLAGLDGRQPAWRVEGDDGIAYIELQPTSVAGSATVSFRFRHGNEPVVEQEFPVWLKSAARDWVVVGFAAGSAGYGTLKDNMQALPEGEDGGGVRADGQVSLYARGRVLGKWMLTLAYDSDKPTERLRNQSLLSTIDPNQYYTLYGDGTQQGYGAASARKVYLKLERDQFYALFGDFQTGLDRNELSRYQRTLNGAKVEYQGQLLEFNGFAARTSQSYARDEIQGDGTSGLYRLRRRGIVINSDRIRIETRDRYHSEQILGTRDLARHIDYDIDYDNGTLFFREPIASRDFDFNPTWIVAEYETGGTTDEFLNGGGRVGVRMMEDRLQAGASYIRQEDAGGRSQLAGVDAKFRPTANDELRAEAAATRTAAAGDDGSGNAWLLEWEHRGDRFNLLAYARRQAGAFGLGQQNSTESGMFKAGVQGQYRLDQRFSLQGEAYRLEDLASGAVRDAVQAQVEYQADEWKARAGLRWARDAALGGTVAESRQVMLGGSRHLFGKKLELNVQADFSLGGSNDSVDFPTRLQLGAAYRINESFRILAAQEFTDGEDRDTSTTRVGFEARPWKDATLTSTLNQSRISEYGPRTFALFGLDQKFLVGEHWGFDVAVDSSQAFNRSGDVPLVVDPSQPIQAGGIRDGGALTETFVALSGGATYRAALWSWNARVEGREGDSTDRYGLTTSFLRQARDGVALSARLQAFSQRNADGSTGLLASAQASWAYRPTGSRWSMLDKLEFRLDQVEGGTGQGIIGNDTLAVTGDARSARMINNFVLNYASDAWAADGATASVLDLDQRSQLSLYYGSKYVLDSFGGDDYAGYTDILGVEWRYDISPRIDIGLRSSVLHSWSQRTFAWAFGPTVGFSPFANTWVSVGYNIRGFNDRDFESSHYTAQGPYLMLRMKFDQRTFGLDRAGNSIPHGDGL